ncbi:MAG: hypothetical protein E7035_00600 [Verrucomicrobiaceae bacterium]|nr:hypothetical protein [Verrucomicrobiaceae bacterium]
MKKQLTLLLLSTTIAMAQMPLVNENFDDANVSETFQKYFHIDVSRTSFENGRMVLDYSDYEGGWDKALAFPKKNKAKLTGKSYKISFDYEILSRNGSGWWTMAVQRRKGREIVNDSTNYFGTYVGQKGTAMVFSNANPSIEKGEFFLAARKTKSKIAIDNLKVEEVQIQDWFFEKDIFWGMKQTPLNGNFISQNLHLLKLSKEEFFPFVDKFGQFKHKEWANKIHSIEDLKKRTKEEKAFYKKIGEIPNRDKYFGYINENYKFNATGRFRTEKVNGRWFFITPEGNLFWSFGVNAVGLYQPSPISKREHFFEDIEGKQYIKLSNQTRLIFKEPYNTFAFEERNMNWKYGKNWRDTYWQVADTRAKLWGVNTFGGWAQPFVSKHSNVPYAEITSAPVRMVIKSKAKLSAYWRDVPDYFDPNFRKRTMRHFQILKPRFNKPHCIGVFVDNELPWQSENLKLARGILCAGKTQHAKIKFAEVLKAKYGNITQLNKAWNSTYKNWSDFLEVDTFVPQTKKGETDMLKIEELMYREYFSVCRDALKSADANVLFLGCRFSSHNPLVRKIATEYCDVVSYNWYKLNTDDLTHPEGSIDKPIIVGEYHFGSQDKGTFGGGLRSCKTMQERIALNNAYVNNALKNPNVIGIHWFRWADQITSGRQNDGENYGCGMVDICDTPVYDFVMSVRNLSEKMYKVRLSEKK